MNTTEIVFMMKVITEKVKLLADEALAKHGLTAAQGNAIRRLYRAGGSLTQKELQEALNISHSTCVGIVQKLENSGFIQTMLPDYDKRQKVIVLTDKASAINQDVDFTLCETEKKLFRSLSNDDITKLYSFLNTIYREL